MVGNPNDSVVSDVGAPSAHNLFDGRRYRLKSILQRTGEQVDRLLASYHISQGSSMVERRSETAEILVQSRVLAFGRVVIRRQGTDYHSILTMRPWTW